MDITMSCQNPECKQFGIETTRFVAMKHGRAGVFWYECGGEVICALCQTKMKQTKEK